MLFLRGICWKFSFISLTIITCAAVSNVEGSYSGSIQRINIREVNLNKAPINYSLWNNEGYQETNATQISHKWNGAQLNVSAHFLMATTMSKLNTVLTNFNCKFLSIKFASMIGKSVPVTTATTLTTLKPTTRATTPTTTTTTTKVTTTSPTTRTTVKATVAPVQQVVAPAVIQLHSPSKPDPQIIEIDIDNADQGEMAVHHPNDKVLVTRRKKRELNSQEISQVHEIISQATSSNNKIVKEKPAPSVVEDKAIPKQNPVVQPAVVPVVAATKAHAAVPAAVPPPPAVPPAGTTSTDQNAQYKTWKASLSQSFRPSGFYVLVDDLVVYDNWEGVWIHNEPNVLGKHVKSSALEIWCHTEILLEWNEPPRKDVKIRFEWDPPSPSSFLFLNDISVSTLSTVDTNSSPPNLFYNPEFSSNNKNITLFIVVKHPEDTKAELDPAVKPVEQTTTRRTTPSTTTTTSSTSTTTTTSTKAPTTVNTTTTSVPYQDSTHKDGKKATATTTLVVAVTLGGISLFILIVLMHTKFKENQRLRGSYC